MPRRLEQLTQDLGYAIRSFRRSPATILVALLSLMLGIGATSAIFSVIYGVLISPYPYARPGEIWSVEARATSGRGGHTYTPQELRRLGELPAVADAMGTSYETVLLTGEFSPESFNGVLMSGTAFNFLGVAPVAGRTLQPTDIRADGQAEPVVVLSHKLWLRLFEGDPGSIGRTLRLNGTPHTIVGVMPPRFGWYGNEGFWLPMSPTRTDLPFVAPIVRLRPGVTREVAQQQIAVLHKAFAEERPATFPAEGFTTVLLNYLDVTVASGEMRTTLRLLLGAVAFLLLIACANVANLQLARGTTRAREMAVRMSIGAGRGRLMRQLLTENVLLSLAGGAAGILFAFAAIRSIVALMPEFYVPNESRVEINLPVLLFAVAVSVLTGIVFGLAPALQTSKPDMTDALKASRSTAAGGDRGRTRNMLVVVEVALSVVLLVSAGLTARTFVALTQVDAGFDRSHVLAIGVPLAPAKYDTLEKRNRFTLELLDRVAALPGAEAAAIGLPFGGPQSPFAVAGETGDESRRIRVNLSAADHLQAFGIPLRRGRMFDAAEVRRGDRVGVLNEAAAGLWPAGHDPIGSRLRLGILERAPARTLIDTARPPEITIVGIVANTRNAGVRAEPTPAVMIPYSIVGSLSRLLAVRTAGDPNLLLNPIRAEVRAMDAEQPLGRPITLDEIMGQDVVQPRFTMALFSTFAGLGLILAAAGIYSVLSFHVTLRTHELGVRMALGAPKAHVLALMLRMGTRLVLVGVAIGIAASLAATRLLRSQLFGVGTADPVAYAGVVAVLGVVTLLACYIPARRAASVDPMVALRQD
jgi:putative ABC transport system permease protein